MEFVEDVLSFFSKSGRKGKTSVCFVSNNQCIFNLLVHKKQFRRHLLMHKTFSKMEDEFACNSLFAYDEA